MLVVDPPVVQLFLCLQCVHRENLLHDAHLCITYHPYGPPLQYTDVVLPHSLVMYRL